MTLSPLSRRTFLTYSAGGALAVAARGAQAAAPAAEAKRDRALRERALVAITLDLEMLRNFPTWNDTHWDYEKGNLNEPTKAYAVEACRRIKQHGGRAHCFVVGRVLEQPDVGWLREIAESGHAIGNHSYDHINVLATTPAELQFRFRRAPWLIGDRPIAEAIAENIRLTNAALKQRVGVEVSGFRTPGGFDRGLIDRPDVQRIVQACGFEWVSSFYPSKPAMTQETGPVFFTEVVKMQSAVQPFVYPGGLIELPMNPVSDVSEFRGGRWKLDQFLKAIRVGLEWAIEHRAVYDFLGHPSCLYAVDPEFKAIELICRMVAESRGKASLVDLNVVAQRAKAEKRPAPPAIGDLLSEAEAIAAAGAFLVAKKMLWGKPVEVQLRGNTYGITYETSAHEMRLLGRRTLNVDRRTGSVHAVPRR